MYNNILRRLEDAVTRKRPENWNTKFWFFPHGNVPAQRLVLVKYF